MANHYVDQPMRRVIKTKTGEMVLEWDPRFANHRNDLYNRAQRYVDAQVLYKSEAFIPVKTGDLIRSGRQYTRIGSGVVMWKSKNYARPVYYGRRPPGRQGPKVTKAFRWFARMKKVSGSQIVNEGRRIAGGGENG